MKIPYWMSNGISLDVIQYATHIDISSQRWIPTPLRLLDWMTELSRALQTADNPVPSLKFLNLSWVNEFLPVLNAIKSNKLFKLECLTLLIVDGEDEKFELLVSIIAADCLLSLKHLKLDGVPPRTRDHISLAKVIKSGGMFGLQTLLLSWSEVEDASWEAYADAISSGKLPFLKRIRFSGIGGIRGMEALGRAFESGELENLIQLDLSTNQLDTDNQRGHFILANQMGSGRMRALETLNLDLTSMKDESCEAYAKAIISGDLPSLSCIRFSYNFIGNKSAEALGRAIRSGELKNLAELNLSGNEITDEGMALLANSFQEGEASILPKIRYLNLSSNAFTGVGLRSLAEALKSGRLDSLEFLNLIGRAESPSSEEDAYALVSAFSSNLHLTVHVYFDWLSFPDLHRRVEQLRKRNLWVKNIVPAAFARVFILGSPKVGKSTLRQTLRRSRFESLMIGKERLQSEGLNRGIDVYQLSGQSSKQDDNTIALQVWDMPGQNCHVAHNAFFPDLGEKKGKATSFVIVCSSKNVVDESKRQMQKSVNREDAKQQVADNWLQQLVYWLKFIASSCGKSTDRRHVLVVLNDFDRGLKVSKYNQFWEQGLEIFKEDFKDYLEIQTVAFIMDVREPRLVQPFKRRLFEHSTSLVKRRMRGDICQFIHKNLSRWSETREHFPVLRWTDFVDKVRQSSREPWPVETLESATKSLNEAGVLMYIDKETSNECYMHYQKLVVLNPSWFCSEIVGNMFLQEDMRRPKFRMKVDKSTGSISESEFKKFFKLLLGTANERSEDDFEDLIAILLWLGLCYKVRGQQLFIPSLIAEDITPWDHWESGSSKQHGEDHWVMGFSVEHSKSKVTIAPMALWHRFQVELAQIPKFNGHPENDFVTGKHFMTFCVDYMSVLIEVSVDKVSPTFDDISIFVKPLRKVDDLDGNRRKQYQVDLASDLVEILLGLWIEVCPGSEYLHKVVWPWPVSQSRHRIVSQRDMEVDQVKKSVHEHGLGRSMQWMVGSSTIKEDQLLSTKDKKDVLVKYQELVHDTLDMLRKFETEAVDEGICPAHVLTEEVQREVSNVVLDKIETPSLPRSAGKLLLRKRESMGKKIVKQPDNIERLVREGFKEVLKKEKQLLGMLQDTGEFILQDRERICPRFIYLGEKGSGAWMTLKDALSRNKATRLHLLCESRFNDHRLHAVKDQQGLDLPELKDWAKTIGPWLKVSLAVIFTSAKVAANVVLPGVASILPDFTQWQQVSSLSDGIALATAFSKEELNQLIMEGGMGLDADHAHQNPCGVNGKSRKALSEFLGKLTPEEYEKKLGLRKVLLSYDDGSHGVVWICRECFEKYASMKVVSELPLTWVPEDTKCQSALEQGFRRFINKVVGSDASGYFVSKVWFLSLDKHHREEVMSVLRGAGYFEIYQTRTTMFYERLDDDMQEEDSDEEEKGSNGEPTMVETNEASIQKDGDALSSGNGIVEEASVLKNAIETSPKTDAKCECPPQVLTVSCTTPTQIQIQPSTSSQGQCNVTIPENEGLTISTRVDKDISIEQFSLWETSGNSKVDLPLNVSAEACLSCCVTSDHANLRIEFLDIRGEIGIGNSFHRRTNACVLRSVRTNVDALIKNSIANPPRYIFLDIKKDSSYKWRRVLQDWRPYDKNGQRKDPEDLMWLELTGKRPKHIRPGSKTLELRYHVQNILKVDIHEDSHEALILYFEGSPPVKFEGKFPGGLDPNSFLELHVRYQVEISYIKDCDTPSQDDDMFVCTTRENKVVEFDCVLKFTTQKLSSQG